MGCTREQGEDCALLYEKPAHSVTLTRSFYMMKSEVTQGLYKKLMGKNPSGFKKCGENCPVEDVSWYDAVRFANKLSEKEGLEKCYSITKSRIDKSKVNSYNSGESASVVFKGLDCTGWRLPTEAEWEYAARGGEVTKYAGSNNVDSVAWYYENSGLKTHAVCGKAKNGYGLCDMSGNVLEWVWDWWGDFNWDSKADPVGPNTGSHRVYRGGSWYYGARDAGVSFPFFTPSSRNRGLGFRLSRSFSAK